MWSEYFHSVSDATGGIVVVQCADLVNTRAHCILGASFTSGEAGRSVDFGEEPDPLGAPWSSEAGGLDESAGDGARRMNGGSTGLQGLDA